jgi:hypothetical protein
MATIGAFGYLLSGVTASGAGADVMDCRYAQNFAYLTYYTTSPSAVLRFDASHDGTAWLNVLTVTAVNASATAQISAHYPYTRGVVNSAFGGGGATATAYMHYAPGLQRAN